MNLPNILTLLRIATAPLLLWLITRGSYGAAVAFLLASAVSDGLDGFIARRFELCTELGAILDPLADKLTIVTSVLALAWMGRLPVWLATAIILRDLIIVGGAIAYYLEVGKLEMAPSIPSKLNTFVQFLLIFLVLVNAWGAVTIDGWMQRVYLFALATTIISGTHYVFIWGAKCIREKAGK